PMEKENYGLNLEEGEDELLLLPIDLGIWKLTFDHYLVGCFLMASVVHFPTMWNIMANLWHLLRGVQISDLGDRPFLFKFFHKMDIKKVIEGVPWTFNSYLLIIHRLNENEELL
ncbi:hypothetical protein J1N35_007766, partial [Gossypium stocksii]